LRFLISFSFLFIGYDEFNFIALAGNSGAVMYLYHARQCKASNIENRILFKLIFRIWRDCAAMPWTSDLRCRLATADACCQAFNCRQPSFVQRSATICRGKAGDVCWVAVSISSAAQPRVFLKLFPDYYDY